MNKLIKFSVTLLASVGAVAPAYAAPILQYQILNGTTLIGSGSSTSGNVNMFGSDSRFMLSGNASGAPFLDVPDFSTSTFSIQTNASNTSGVLTVRISATGLTGYSGGDILNSFTVNSLNGGPFRSATLSTYFDNSNTAFGTGSLLASRTYTGLNSFSDSVTTLTQPSSLFSETAIYTFNYGTGGRSTVSASTQLTAVTAVPEPATWAMMLVGFGMVAGTARYRRRGAKVTYA